MINVTETFIRGIKKIFKEKNLSPLEYVFCFVCGSLSAKSEVELSFIIIPVESFEINHEKLPFRTFVFYKKVAIFSLVMLALFSI